MTRARDLANLIGSGNFTTETLTATAGQTAFTPSNPFTSNFLQVFYNGLLLDPTVDYTENGTTITLTVAATAGDEMEVVTYNTFSVGDAITQTEADNRYVNAAGDTMTGSLFVGKDQAGTTELVKNFTTSHDAANRSKHLRVGIYDGAFSGMTIENIAADNGTQNSQEIRFDTHEGGISVATRMKIDSRGRVTMPYQPAFASVLPTDSIMVGGLTTIPFTTVLLDVSNGLNNGNFTAPVSGNYFISASLSFDGGKDASDDTGFFGIYKNNTAYMKQVYNPIKWSLVGVENTTSIAGVVYLSASDTVQIRHYDITQTPSPKFLANYCNFSGYLIG